MSKRHLHRGYSGFGACITLAITAISLVHANTSPAQAQFLPWQPEAACTSTTAVCAPVDPAGGQLFANGAPHYAYSPALQKFLDRLPALCGPTQTSTAPRPCIPVAAKSTLNGADYYELSVKDYQQRMHSQLPAAGTHLRGYVQTNGTVWANQQKYLGPVIVAMRGTPVRLKVKNEVTLGAFPVPVDTTIMGSGMGPPIRDIIAGDPLNGPNVDAAGNPVSFPDGKAYCTVAEALVPGTTCVYGDYSLDRAEIHLHGGFTPWISDGTPHQWFTPAADTSIYKKGVSFRNVPDMAAGETPTDATGTYYYTNDQSARLMFYHDHTYGITGPNVYAGEAAGYLLTDQIEQDMITAGATNGTNAGYRGQLAAVGVTDVGTPLVIQDKTFVTTSPGTIARPQLITGNVDPTWSTACKGIIGGASACTTEGDLWFPHVYMSNQLPGNTMNPFGRWDYGAYVIPPAFIFASAIPAISHVPEAFMDTQVVNGMAFPYMEVPRKPMRFRVLNASNDRHLNLQLYYAVDGDGKVGSTAKNYGKVCNSPQTKFASCTEVGMVPSLGTMTDFVSPYAVPAFGNITPAMNVYVPADLRLGGVPDPRNQIPFIQIGTEGGLLPNPVVHTNQPIDWDYDRKSMTVMNIRNTPSTAPIPLSVSPRCNAPGCTYPNPGYTLYLGPAERADIIVDFGAVPDGATIILYNDAPAALPAGDPRYDMFTGQPDQTTNGGPLATQKGYGPNTRTVMQFRVMGQQIFTKPTSATNPTPVTVKPSDKCKKTTPGTVNPCMLPPGWVQNVLPGMIQAAYANSHTDPVVDPAGVVVPATTDAAGNETAPSYLKGTVDPPTLVDMSSGTLLGKCDATDQSGCGNGRMCGYGTGCLTGINEFPICAGAVQDPATGHWNNSGDPNYRKTCGFPVRTKTIVEDFDPVYGRLNAMLGTESTALEPNGQNAFGLMYVDPGTETLREGETEIWNIVHNGVDTHAVHFHLMNVQVINRVDWGGIVKLPDANETGFKETVKMNPLENIVIAVRLNKPPVPFVVSSSKRPLDVTTALGVTNPNAQTLFPFRSVDPVTNAPPVNRIEDFGWEYVWHCHLLGHEENDMMRPLVMKVQ